MRAPVSAERCSEARQGVATIPCPIRLWASLTSEAEGDVLKCSQSQVNLPTRGNGPSEVADALRQPSKELKLRGIGKFCREF